MSWCTVCQTVTSNYDAIYEKEQRQSWFHHGLGYSLTNYDSNYDVNGESWCWFSKIYVLRTRILRLNLRNFQLLLMKIPFEKLFIRRFSYEKDIGYI